VKRGVIGTQKLEAYCGQNLLSISNTFMHWEYAFSILIFRGNEFSINEWHNFHVFMFSGSVHE